MLRHVWMQVMHQEAILKASMVKTLPPLTYHMPTKNASTCRIGVQAFNVSHQNKALVPKVVVAHNLAVLDFMRQRNLVFVMYVSLENIN